MARPNLLERRPQPAPAFSDWQPANALALDAVGRLEAMGLAVLGYEVRKDKQPLVSIATPAPGQLEGQCMWWALTQDKTLLESHYIAHFAGCLVRWSEISEVGDEAGEDGP